MLRLSWSHRIGVSLPELRFADEGGPIGYLFFTCVQAEIQPTVKMPHKSVCAPCNTVTITSLSKMPGLRLNYKVYLGDLLHSVVWQPQ